MDINTQSLRSLEPIRRSILRISLWPLLPRKQSLSHKSLDTPYRVLLIHQHSSVQTIYADLQALRIFGAVLGSPHVYCARWKKDEGCGFGVFRYNGQERETHTAIRRYAWNMRYTAPCRAFAQQTAIGPDGGFTRAFCIQEVARTEIPA